MSREQRRKPWSGTLPGGRKIAGILPDILLSRRALEMVSGSKIKDVGTAMAEANENLLRLCLKRLGDRELTYEELRHGGLDRLLGPREKELVKKAFRTLRQPNEAEHDFLERTLSTTKDGRKWSWSGRMLTGSDLDDWHDAEEDLLDAKAVLADAEFDLEAADVEDEDVDLEDLEACVERATERVEQAEAALEEAEAKAVEIEGLLQNSKIIRMCVEQVPKDLKKRGEAFVEKEVSENLIRNCVRSIDGRKVEYSDLRETGLDDWLSTKEQNLVIYAIMELGQPDEQEVEDFLGSLEIG